MAISEVDFIGAVQAAVNSPPKGGTKWRQLETLFADNGLRGNGALNNSGGADRTTRIRQMGTSKVHAGHVGREVADHSVFVLGGDTVKDYLNNPDRYCEQVEQALLLEHKNFISCLIMLAEPDSPVRPIRLIKRTSEPLVIPYEEWWSDLPVTLLPLTDDKERSSSLMPPAANSIGSNIIYFGSPGTGKSTYVKNMVLSNTMFRTQFHPDYNYADLIGSYRPVVGYEVDTSNQIVGHDGVLISRPISYFSFVPGPLIDALMYAYNAPNEQVFFVIEEINRGDCAAIFGDLFQLLDRNENGSSEYGITLKPELSAYFNSKKVNYDINDDEKLYLPSNLTLLATMNTCDQSLYPMDAAFKRRWQWVACPINFQQLSDYCGGRPFLNDGAIIWDWIGLLEKINQYIVRDRMEDRQLGPWFIKPTLDGEISFEGFLNKCLFYLWHDVFKDEQLMEASPFRPDGPETFGEFRKNILDNGLVKGFKDEVLEGLRRDSNAIDSTNLGS